MMINSSLTGSASITNTTSNGTLITTSSNTYSTTINPNLYTVNPAYTPSAFSISFSWEGKEVNIGLKKGDDVFKLANAFMEWLDKNDIEYNVKTKGRKKKQ